jgi:outer membrane protein assembly factor BamB
MIKFKPKIFSAIALSLLISMIIPMIVLPPTNAHTPAWEISSFAYIAAQPDPVGVGQRVMVYMWVDAPLPSSSEANDIRRHDYKLTITKPDATTEVMQWPSVSDTTGVQYTNFTPDQVGTYTLLFEYAGQVYTWDSTAAMRTWTGDTFLPDSASTTVTVQEEPLPAPILSYPLPAEYWTRPIEGQNTDWWTISSNWLNAPFNRVGDSGTQGAVSSCDTQGGYGRLQPDGTAPNSPHIMWTRAIEDGGVVGGSLYDVLGKTYYMGGSYNVRFRDAIVMHGRLYYEEPWGNSGSGGDYVCVDIRTGEELWRIDTTSENWAGKPVFGYLYSYDTMNQHGVVPNGLLFTFNFGRAYDARTGRLTTLNLTNVPSGTPAAGPQGEILRYVWNSAGKWLAQWNSSLVFTTQNSGTIDAGTAARYDWNKTISVGPGTWSINRHVVTNNILLLEQGSFGGPRVQGTGMNITAINLKPGSEGQVMWSKYYPVAPNNVTRKLIAVDAETGTFVFQDKETLELTGCSLADGNKLWSQVPNDANWDTMRSTSLAAYGKLYVSGFDGILHCYDMKTGNLLWTYGNGGPGNSTYAGLETAWGHYPIFVDVIADGKVYLGTTEHSPDSPFYKAAQYRCIDANTGEELWTIMGWGTGMYVGQSNIVADGFYIYLNCYDQKIYSLGKGPSAMTVEAPKAAIELGKSLVISGTVTDISAGTKQAEQAARFPNGVPAVSDESMTSWMEYVYMQKPHPTDVTGVPVTINVVDANGNYREIGLVTSDSNGFFSLNWKPDIEGKYTVYASFGGSESYWSSNAVTSFAVDPAAPTQAPAQAPITSMADTYIVPGIIAIILAIAVGFAITILVLRKRP